MKSPINVLINYYLILLIGLALFVLFTGDANARTVIAVVDTGIIKTKQIKPYLCEKETDLTGKGITDVNGHGTNVAHIIARYIDPAKYCLHIIKWFHDNKVEIKNTYYDLLHISRIAEDTMYVIEDIGAKFVNMSIDGGMSFWKEKLSMYQLLDKGVVFAVAAGNQGSDLSIECNSYPACYKFPHPNFYVIGGSHNRVISRQYNFNGPVDAYEEAYHVKAGGFTMSGTSQATPAFLGKYIQKLKGEVK